MKNKKWITLPLISVIVLTLGSIGGYLVYIVYRLNHMHFF